MTKVRFTFVDIQGNPLPLMEFKLIVRRASFNIEDVGVTLPEEITVTTDVTGQVIVDLWPLKTAYRIQVAEEYEELCGKLNWSFYVPHTTEIVEAQTLFLVPPPNNLPWDEEAMGKITQAVIDSKGSAEASEASAVRAENAAQSTEGDADRAEAARDAAEASKNAAAGSAQSAANSAAASGQSATDALASKNAAANSANAANNSAVSASNDAGRAAASEAAALASKNAAAGSATAAAGSATTATNAANSATASKDAAAASATTASTKAGEASTSAGNALTQANRAKTEADRATAASDGKQDKNTNLTALAGVSNPAINRFPIWTSASSMTSYLMTEYSISLLSLGNKAAFKSEFGYADRGANSDITSISGLTTALSIAQGGTGAINAAAARTNLQLGTMAIEAATNYPSKAATGIGTNIASEATGYDTPGNGQGGGFYTVGQGPSSSEVTYASMIRVPYANSRYEAQILFPMGESRNRMLFRVSLGSSSPVFGKAQEVYHTSNVEADPSTGLGIMQTYALSGYIITKFLSGELLIRGIAPLTRTLGVNEIFTLDITLPMSLTNGVNGYAFAGMCVARPQNTYDSYGVTNQFLASPNTVTLVIRNGATAQTFSPIVTVWGRWK